jgi:RNA polymerase sigma-B factor
VPSSQSHLETSAAQDADWTSGSDVVLFGVLADPRASDQARRSARTALVTRALPLVTRRARRFVNRGEFLEDLVQEGAVGLIQAVDRYEPSRGIPFASYAVPMVDGAIRRYFRDRARAVRVPRRLQSLAGQVRDTQDSLHQELGRRPSTADVADALGRSRAEVTEGLLAINAGTALSLDAVATEDGGLEDGVSASRLSSVLGEEDRGYADVVARQAVRELLNDLSPLHREVIRMVYFGGLTQAEVGARIGVSQMQVSRLLRRGLSQLRRSCGQR